MSIRFFLELGGYQLRGTLLTLLAKVDTAILTKLLLLVIAAIYRSLRNY
jgi:hypothetical protein